MSKVQGFKVKVPSGEPEIRNLGCLQINNKVKVISFFIAQFLISMSHFSSYNEKD